MIYGIYHNNRLLLRTQDADKAWEKARMYGGWFNSIEVRSYQYGSND